MTKTLPSRLTELLKASSQDAKDEAWEGFVAQFSKIILRAARNGSSSHDETMDRYAFALEKLRADEFGRLRGFKAYGRGQFTTWLFLVTRRLSVDYYRKQFGRTLEKASEGGVQPDSNGEQTARRRLAGLLAEELDPARLPDTASPDPEEHAWMEERRQILNEALDHLSPRDHLLITLRFVDDVSVRQIARAMSFNSPFQVYRRLKKILARLRLHLEERGINGP